MLTINFDQLGLEPGDRLLDVGAGTGRHSFEGLRRGADVVALDLSQSDLHTAEATLLAMVDAGESHPAGRSRTLVADALCLPFPDGSFDAVIASEVLEHISDDERAIGEISRVVKRGGRVAVSVPRWWPERICWAISSDYHSNEGGHLRIYRGHELRQKLEAARLRLTASHHAHALHSPYWWLRCWFGVRDEKRLIPRIYHRLLVWDITHRPVVTRLAEIVLNPLLGKSLVLYLEKA